MTGCVRCFLPAARRGVLQTETGDELTFLLPTGVDDLQGGDIVEFESGAGDRPIAVNVTLRQRWAEALNQDHRSLVNQFHDTIKILA